MAAAVGHNLDWSNGVLKCCMLSLQAFLSLIFNLCYNTPGFDEDS
jgi:hypothetical protein